VLDLLANAKRRKEEGRVDDAVARLYRAIEAVAQVALKERYGIDSTTKIPLDRIPAVLRPEWDSRANEGFVTVGLQDAYALLASLEDPLADKFRNAALNGTESPLVARNQSILAHGFVRVTDAVFEKLWASALSLADIQEEGLPAFPALGERA
jgi:CRISPR-associated protein (TIGR02710 family)